MIVTMTKEELLERLNDRLKAAKAEDARMLKEHQGKEQNVLREFRNNLRLAMKWDYQTFKRYNYEVSLKHGSRPDCPVSNARDIARVLLQVKLDTRTTKYSIQPGTDVHNAITWLPVAEQINKNLCGD